VGYVTKTLSVGFNAYGLNLHAPTVAAGNFETISGTLLTDNGVTYSPVPNRTYILEITSGVLKGVIQEVPAASIVGSSITTPQDLQALGLTSQDGYSLRVARTLEETFTTVPLASGGVLNAALSSGTADIVWIPNGSGGYTQYFLHSSTQAFRLAGTTTPTPNVPIVYSDGFFVQKKTATAASLVVTGEVKKVGTTSVAVTGFNPVSSVAPAGLNLFNAGLESTLTAALSAGTADVVWVQQPNLTYVQYFRRSGTGAGWRVVDTTTTLTQAQAEAVDLTGGFLIQRKGAASINIKLNAPTSFDNL
jgi:hypothetical protein